MSKSKQQSRGIARKVKAKRRDAGKGRRTMKKRQRKGGYTYKSNNRKSRQPGRYTSRANRITSVTKEIQKIVPNDSRFLEALFASIDTDGSGEIDRDEFKKYFSTKKR